MAVIRVEILFCLVVMLFVFVKCEEEIQKSENEETFARALEEGRTFVHNTMKRLAFLLPLLMFKLGVMFTLLVVATLTSTKGLMVGSLLLALGVGHFIANRFSHAPATAHISYPAPWPAAHAHYIDRSGYAEPTAQGQAYNAWKQ